MKVAIITILDNVNFGTYLQALATGIAIKSLGHDAEIIHYIRPVMTSKGYSKTLLKERGLLRWLKRHNYINKIKALRDQNYCYLRQFLPVSEEFTSFEMLCKKTPQADVYMTGSDQVWNSIYNRGIDRSYYLDFAPKGRKRVAYAASIGMNDFPNNEKNETKSLLMKYSKITVRERQAQVLLNSIGIESDIVLDPTLLLDSAQWSAIANKNSDFCVEEKYVLIYSVEEKQQDRLIEKYAYEIAKQKGLMIYQVSYGDSSKRLKCSDRFFGQATPNIFLNLMKNASFAVVSSFHGTAFAINFNIPFLTIAPRRFNSRVQNLLEITQLKDRLITDSAFSVTKIENIDFAKVNNLLAKEREHSYLHLRIMVDCH